MESNSMSDSLPSSEGVIDEIDLQDSGRTSLGLSSSAGPAESVVLNKSEKDSTESEIQDSILFNLDASMSNSVPPTNTVDLNESISIIDPPNSVYIDTDDPSIIDLSKDPQEVVFGQYGGHGAIPAHVWSRRLDKQFKPLKEFKVSISEGLRLLGLGYRMYKYTNREKGAGRLPVIDPFGTPKATPTMGVPLGGLGSGTIGRGWRGEFNKWQIYSGTPKSRVVEADAFSAFIEFDSPPETTSPRLTRQEKITASVLTPNPNPNPNLKTWNWKVKGDKTTYNALYPRAWTVYEEPHPDIRLECRQISPVIPHNYKESSYPVGVFVWKITNNAKTNAKVSIMFSFQNGSGGLNDLEGGHVNKLFETTRYDDKITGVTMSHNRLHPIRKQNTSNKSPLSDTNLNSSTSIENTADSSSSISSSSSSTSTEKKKKIKPVSKQVNSDHVVKNYSDPVTFAIGVKQSYGMEVSYNTKWATNSKASATALWDEFSSNGKLKNNNDERPSQKGESIGSALAAKVSLAPGETREIVFSLAWDIPILRFTSGSAYYRRYTKFYGTHGDVADDIVSDALHAYPKWEKLIHEWQQPVLDDPELPDFYKHALFNELYYIADGGTVWTDGHVSGKKIFSHETYGPLASDTHSIGHFAYLEGQEYLMLNTYDVHFYASFALVMNWPLLELSLQRDVAMATLSNDSTPWEIFFSGKVVDRKVTAAVPHDMGNPGEDPWFKVNSYCIQDISRWKDLPSKLVLQLYRDYVATRDDQFLRDCWHVVELVVSRTADFDTDGDGVVDNEGFPDQTYDTWSATGCSAYSGGLWIAALSAASRMASILGKPNLALHYNEMYEKAKTSFESKLWNGKYYKYDCSSNFHHDSIMADQMAGEWYAVACGLPPIVPPANAKSALKTVFDFNVKKFAKGEMGAVNGMKPNGQVDTMCMQSIEVWTGTTFAVAATMIQEGMKDEAFETAKGIVNTSYERLGYMFQTPEAWDVNGGYRAAAYMRPLSIWAIQWAWENRNRDADNN